MFIYILYFCCLNHYFTEQQLVGAAKEVAKTLKGDSEKLELELLSKVLNLKTASTDETTSEEASKEAPEPSLGLVNYIHSN